MTAFADYLGELRQNLDKGDSTEHTHRPALKTLLEACGKDIAATNKPRRIACGARLQRQPQGPQFENPRFAAGFTAPGYSEQTLL